MRSTAVALLVVLLALASPSSAAPAVANLEFAADATHVEVPTGETVTLELTVDAELECAVGFDGPKGLRGAMRGVVRTGDDATEFARSPFVGMWQRTNANSQTYILHETLTLRVPADAAGLRSGDNEVVIQLLPDEPRNPAGTCQPDGYRLDPAEETFTITVVSEDPEAQDVALDIQSGRPVALLPMLLALGLVALLAVFAVRRERRSA